jgi:hypothetical protein
MPQTGGPVKLKVIATLSIAFIVVVPAFAQTKTTDTNKIENIQRLIKMTKGEDVRDVMVNQFLDALRPAFAAGTTADQAKSRDMFNRFANLLTEEFRRIDFTSVSVSLYDKYFSNEEILGLIHFYETPVGQKAVQVLPQLMQESMLRGQEQGQQAASRAMTRLMQEFPELRTGIPALPASR